MLAGSAAASFLVERMGPEGFASREQIMQRISNGERTEEGGVEGFSLTLYSPKKK